MKNRVKDFNQLIEMFRANQRASPKPYFFERLNNRIQSRQSKEIQFPALRYQVAMLLLFAFINIASLIFINTSQKTTLDQDIATVIELYDLHTDTEDLE
ncbi:MAG: hypothetical protein SFU91_01480 [Chloroherpetonaceae bacterium]|nr:hypothetical protein [Chloroherpetonaceae bacterium]